MFIHDAKTDAQKAELFGRVRSGDVRVLIGSTDKMGAGTNVRATRSQLKRLCTKSKKIYYRVERSLKSEKYI